MTLIYEDDDDPVPDHAVTVQTSGLACPCGDAVPLALTYWVEQQGDRQYIRTRADLADLHGHSWMRHPDA